MAEIKCTVCRKKIESKNGYVRIADGIACEQCWEKAELGFFAQFSAKNYTVASMKDIIRKKISTNKPSTASKPKIFAPAITIEMIDEMNGIAFENYMKKLLEKMGYSSVKTTAKTGDQGVDLLAKKGVSKYAIQCKRYKGNVGNKAVQEVFSGAFFYKCDKCIVVTNSYFTNSAKELAKANKVELWDRDKLKEFIEKYGKRIK